MVASGAERTSDPIARLMAIGARPPLRGRRAGDYRRERAKPQLTTSEIDALLDEVRGER